MQIIDDAGIHNKCKKDRDSVPWFICLLLLLLVLVVKLNRMWCSHICVFHNEPVKQQTKHIIHPHYANNLYLLSTKKSFFLKISNMIDIYITVGFKNLLFFLVRAKTLFLLALAFGRKIVEILEQPDPLNQKKVNKNIDQLYQSNLSYWEWHEIVI